MPTVDVHVPLKLRLTGTPTDEQWRRLEDVLTAHYARVFRATRAADSDVPDLRPAADDATGDRGP